MLTRLGAPTTPADAVGLLLECHDRIRSFLTLARRIAAARPGESGLAEAAARVVRYFSEALPLHARDEEESVLPRLRGREPELDAALAAMEREHRVHGPAIVSLVAACRLLEADPTRLASVAPELERASVALEEHFALHLQREETLIFPALRRLLSTAEDQAIVRELRARRAGR